MQTLSFAMILAAIFFTNGCGSGVSYPQARTVTVCDTTLSIYETTVTNVTTGDVMPDGNYAVDLEGQVLCHYTISGSVVKFSGYTNVQ